MQPIIEIQNISKKYRIGANKSYLTLREQIAQKFKALTKRQHSPFTLHHSRGSSPQDFWALKNISLTVQEGEVVGIIGRNGAGKSTLLKILSKITPPTEGKIIMRGRVASLLEVGTGFHPELTGRENIYLNGAILGMTRREIRKKFDEIVAFAEVERFLDTPVKRYSSGMYVRLAFAVAAHLEPEILIVDEVLAVGDAGFQQRCLGKMGEIARGGRTVIFVSHSMPAVRSLCSRGLLIEQGEIIGADSPQVIIDRYVQEWFLPDSSEVPGLRQDRTGTGAVKLEKVTFINHSGNATNALISGETCAIDFLLHAREPLEAVTIAYTIRDDRAQYLFRPSSDDRGCALGPLHGHVVARCAIPRLPLVAGRYRITVELRAKGQIADYLEGAAMLHVEAGDFYGSGRVSNHSPVLLEHDWQLIPSQ